MSYPIPHGSEGEFIGKEDNSPFILRSIAGWDDRDNRVVALIPTTLGGGSSHYPHFRPILVSSADVEKWTRLQSRLEVEAWHGGLKDVVDYDVEFDEPVLPLIEDQAGGPRAEQTEDEPRTANKDSGTSTMNQPSREEIDAKFQAVEARMDARVTEVTSRIDTLISRMDARDAVHATQFANITEKLNSLSGLRTVIVTTVIGTGIGIVGLVYAMMSGMSSSFDSGRDTAQLTASAQAASERAQVAAEKSASATETALRAINFAFAEAQSRRGTVHPSASESRVNSETPADEKKP